MASGTVVDMPTTPPNGDVLYEVVNGEYRELPPMGAFEVSLAKILLVAMDNFGLSKGLGEAYGEMLFLLDAAKKLERRPDVAFVSYQRWPKGKRVPQSAAWPVVPNLAAEVISPSNSWNEIVEKIADYFRTGVELVWVVSPTTEQVYVYTAPNANSILDRTEALDGGIVLPGFALPLSQLFGSQVS
jgi:Uma2 family endonuclease